MTTDPKEYIDPFNLSDFDEAAERARLRPIEKGDVPSPEIQQAFVKWVEPFQPHRMRGSFNVQPEKLFFSYSEQSEPGRSFQRVFERVYYKPPSGVKFSQADVQYNLGIVLNKNWDYASIERYGESPNTTRGLPEKIHVSFNATHHDPAEEVNFYNISIGAQFEGRKLVIYYKETGSIDTISFELEGLRDSLYASDPPSHSDFKISELFQTGEASFRVGKSEYRASYDRQTEQINLTRMESGEERDVVTLPRQIDGKQKFDELFPKPFLDDIFGASTEQDRTWKDINLDTFGVKWDRPTPNPT